MSNGGKTASSPKVNLTKDIENQKSKKKKTGDTESCSESENDHPHHNKREQRLAARRSVKFREKYFPETKRTE